METLNTIFAFVGWFILCSWGCCLVLVLWLIFNYRKTEKAFFDEYGEKLAKQAKEIARQKLEERRKENANADSNT